MATPVTQRHTDVDSCVEATLSRVGKEIVLGLPLGIGKPNRLVNAFVRRAAADPSIKLTIMTALSLTKPRGKSDLERRFLEPFVARVFGDYEELEYVELLRKRRLPPNISVHEFFFEPGAWLTNPEAQQGYFSSNYTHVTRDLLDRGLNVVAQLVAAPPQGESSPGLLSLGSNPDITTDLLPHIVTRRSRGEPFVLIGQIHPEMPYMYGDALVAADSFDILLEEERPAYPLFCPPNAPIAVVEHAIALNVSALIRDGGTLQLGIGELGDAIVYALMLRHEKPAVYREILESTGVLARARSLIESEGGTAPFERGLYGCTEMLVDGFLDLHKSGIIKRRVYPSARIQRLIDEGHINADVGEHVLVALNDAGVNRLSYADFNEFRDVGLFRDDVHYEKGMLVAPGGVRITAGFEDAEDRAAIAQHCLGERLRIGVLIDAGFFVGPKDFYQRLRAMEPDTRRCFAMRGISFVNELYGYEWELKCAQRRHARFINSAMMVTALGSAISDGLGDGRVVSGVGGQYNFVAMAHALPEARSILCLRSTRTAHGATTSNVLWSYGHTTIPRHLRDIVVTEYGVADLRGKSDREVVEALLAITDARFQPELVRAAQAAGKLPSDYQLADRIRQNLPQTLERQFAPWRKQGHFAELPFGSDFTAEELVLAKALRHLQGRTASGSAKAMAVTQAVFSGSPAPSLTPYLKRMQLDAPRSFGDRIERNLLARSLLAVLKT
jgi:acyl-CoA hydrolase